MIELGNADVFISNFERYGRKIQRIPLTYFDGRKVNLLMSKCGRRWICLPYLSEGVVETQNVEVENPPFALFESEDGNLCSTNNSRWEIRDRRAYSNHLYNAKVNFHFSIRDLDTPLLDVYPSNVKRKVKKAISNGLELKSGGRQYLNHFYKIYSRRMHTIGVCPCGKRYIKQRLKGDDYWLFVVYHGNKPVGVASLMKNSPLYMENEFFATDSDFNHLYTSYMLHYGMMSFAKEHQADYSLGRSTFDSSVYQYKQHFKAEQHQLFWSHSHRTTNIRNRKFLYTLWRLLPYRIMLLIAPFVYRRVF